MRWLIYPLVLVFALSGVAFAQGKSGSKPKGPKNKHEEATVPDTTEDILEGILGDDDDDGKGKGKGKNKNKNKGHNDDDDGVLGGIGDIIFGEDERETIGDYYSKNRVNVDTLPPGIAKNLARGKPLPPGIAKKNLPEGLASQLPRLEGYKRIITGQDIVLVDEKTEVVVDILRGVLGH